MNARKCLKHIAVKQHLSAPITSKIVTVKFVLDAVAVVSVTTPMALLLVCMKTCKFMISVDITTGHHQVTTPLSTLLTLVFQVTLEFTY